MPLLARLALRCRPAAEPREQRWSRAAVARLAGAFVPGGSPHRRTLQQYASETGRFAFNHAELDSSSPAGATTLVGSSLMVGVLAGCGVGYRKPPAETRRPVLICRSARPRRSRATSPSRTPYPRPRRGGVRPDRVGGHQPTLGPGGSANPRADVSGPAWCTGWRSRHPARAAARVAAMVAGDS